MSQDQARTDVDPNSVTTPVDVNTQLYLRLLQLLKISKMTAAEIVDVALRVTATAIENVLMMHTEGRVTYDMIEKELGKQAKKKRASVLGLSEDDETDKEMITRMRKAKEKGHVTYADDVEDEEIHLGAKLLSTLQSILTPPKEPDVAVPQALVAARESVSGGEIALPLPVDAMHRMIGSYMQKYGLKKKHETSRGVLPVTYCRYCSALVNMKDQEKGIFCCEDARRLKNICKEWKQRVLSVSESVSDDVEDEEERKMGPKLVTTLKTILSLPKEPALAIPEALQAAQERVSGGEMAMPLPVQAVHKMIGSFMEKYGLKKHKITMGADPVLICRYCSAEVDLKEQKKGVFCCDAAKRLNDICQEWKQRVMTGTGAAGLTETQRVTKKKSQLPDEIREAKAQELKGPKEDQSLTPGTSRAALGKKKSQLPDEIREAKARELKGPKDQSLKPGTSWAALGKDASSVKVKKQERMKLEKIREESEFAPRREGSKLTAKAQQEESKTQKGLKKESQQ